MSGHTPGPWGITRDFDAGILHEVAVIYGAGDGAIYIIADPDNFMSSDYRAKRFADAALIAAAPELLSALMDLCDRAEGLESKCLGTVMARAAIAKATGVAP